MSLQRAVARFSKKKRHRLSLRVAHPCALLMVGLLLTLMSCGEGHTPTAPTPGVTNSEILLGASCALDGHASFLGTQYLRGSQMYFDKVNSSGGVHGRKLRLIALDDGYDPPRTVANTKRLINEEGVFMLFGYVGTPTSVKIIDLVHETGVPAFGFFTGAEPLRTPYRPQMFHVRGSYFAEAEAAISYFADQLGLNNIAVMYQDDAFGHAVLTGIQLALQRRDMEISSTGTYQRGSMEVTRALDVIAVSDADAVVMVGTYAPLARFIRLAHERDFHPYFHTVSFIGSEAFARELIDKQQVEPQHHERIIVTQVVPSPAAEELEAVAAYRRLAVKHYPEDTPNYVALEGFVNARILVEALRRVGSELTRQRLIDTLEALDSYDPGLGVSVSYGPLDHKGLDKIFYSRLTSDGSFRTFEP